MYGERSLLHYPSTAGSIVQAPSWWTKFLRVNTEYPFKVFALCTDFMWLTIRLCFFCLNGITTVWN